MNLKTPEDIVAISATGDIGGGTTRIRYTGAQSGARFIQEFVQDQFFGRSKVNVSTATLDLTHDVLPEPDGAVGLDMITLHCDDLHRIADDSDVVLPLRVHMTVDVTGSWEQVCARMSRRETKRNTKWSQNPRHSSRLSHDPDEYFWFYETMVAPSMANIYGSRSRMLTAEDGFQQVFQRGGLFLVEVDGEPVAGSVSEIDYTTRRVAGRIIGVKRGDQHLRADGTQNAVYHAIIEWAWRNSFATVDFGNSEPFLSKGTFQYKMRFGSKVVLPPTQHSNYRTLLRWNAALPGVTEFLVNNPVVLIDDQKGQFGAGYFSTASRPPCRDISYLPTTGITFDRNIPLSVGAE